jgi:hypothetical protein
MVFAFITFFPNATAVAGGVLFGTMMLYAVYRVLRHSVHDLILVRRLKLRERQFHDAGELLAFVAQLGRSSKKVEILRFARDQNRLDTTETNERYLRDVALEIERYGLDGNAKPRLLGNEKTVDPELLDELSMLAEQIRVLRGVGSD